MTMQWLRRFSWAAVAAAVAIVGYAYLERAPDGEATTPPPLLGPVDLGHGGRVQLERQPGALPRMRVVGGSIFDERALVALYSFMGRVLDRRKPFTVLWDPRSVVWPRVGPRQLAVVRTWVDANAVRWDTHVQAHALLVTNPLVRPIARLVLRLVHCRHHHRLRPARAAPSPHHPLPHGVAVCTATARASRQRRARRGCLRRELLCQATLVGQGLLRGPRQTIRGVWAEMG